MWVYSELLRKSHKLKGKRKSPLPKRSGEGFENDMENQTNDGTKRLFHYGEHLRPSGLYVEALLGAGHGGWDRSAAGRPLRQPVGSNRRKGLKIAHSSLRTFGKNSPKRGRKPGEGQKRKIQKPAWLPDGSRHPAKPKGFVGKGGAAE